MRARREPPRFRRVAVRRVERLSSRMVRVTLAGPDLEGLTVEQPAASVRLLLPSPGAPELVIPSWNGNEFLLPDGRRPTIRTFTPRRVDPEALELDLEIVIHGGGVASQWAEAAEPGDPAAISGPGRGYAIDRDAPAFLLAGDETAIPAISQLLEALPAETPVQVHIEVAHPDARLALPDHPRRDRRVVRPAAAARRRATRSSPPSAAPTSPPAPGCGRPAKPRRCSASGATSSRIEGCPAPRPRSAATGSTAAVATPTTLERPTAWRITARKDRPRVPRRRPRRRLPSRGDLAHASRGWDCFRRPGRCAVLWSSRQLWPAPARPSRRQRIRFATAIVDLRLRFGP